MLSIVLLGTGNVARHLFDAFERSENLRVLQVVGRSPSGLDYFKKSAKTSSIFTDLVDADIYIIALSDDAISIISEQLKIKNKFLVHTSGSVGISVLSKQNRAGVFYPLQSFSKGRKPEYKDIPICIEAAFEADLEILKELASQISEKVFVITSEQRRMLHLAAVFVNNFVNHMYVIGAEICREQQLPFSILQPLIKETCEKIEDMAPLEAQTGPARRSDEGTLIKHGQLLKTEKSKEIYMLLSESIQETYGKKL